MDFFTECDQDMLEMIDTFGVPIVFGEKSAQCVTSQVTMSVLTENSGMLDEIDSEARLRLSDFQNLGITFQDEVEISGELMRVVVITKTGLLAILGLKAIR